MIVRLTHFAFLAVYSLHPHKRALWTGPWEPYIRLDYWELLWEVFWNLKIKWFLFITALMPLCYSRLLVSRKCAVNCWSSSDWRKRRQLCLCCGNLLIWFCLALWFQISQHAGWFYDTPPPLLFLSLSPLAPSLFHYPPHIFVALWIYSPMIINRF